MKFRQCAGTNAGPASVTRRDAGIEARLGSGHAGSRAVVHAVIISDVAAGHRRRMGGMICDTVETKRRKRGGAGKYDQKEHEPGQFVGHGLFRYYMACTGM